MRKMDANLNFFALFWLPHHDPTFGGSSLGVTRHSFTAVHRANRLRPAASADSWVGWRWELLDHEVSPLVCTSTL